MIGGLVILAAACAGWAVTLNASDPVGVYAVVEKIVLEPSDAAPQRIQIWGAFSLAEQKTTTTTGRLNAATSITRARRGRTASAGVNGRISSPSPARTRASDSAAGTKSSAGSAKPTRRPPRPTPTPSSWGVVRMTGCQESLPVVDRLKAALKDGNAGTRHSRGMGPWPSQLWHDRPRADSASTASCATRRGTPSSSGFRSCTRRCCSRFPSVPVVGIGLWWTANTAAHNFIHTPFFRSRALNRLYSVFLSARSWASRRACGANGISGTTAASTPGTRMDARHDARDRRRLCAVDDAGGGGARRSSRRCTSRDTPSGSALCFLQGHFEHARGTTSHYGWLYNRCFFNDGYHAEHHLRPGEHWTRLPRQPHARAHTSRWPPVLRWLDAFTLDSLERIVLRLPLLQRFVVAVHERAFRRLLARIPPVHRVTIVGGGLFPRSAIVLQRLVPGAALTIVDASLAHLEVARRFFTARSSSGTALRPGLPEPADLVVIPLSFIGNRDRVYREPAAPAVLSTTGSGRRAAGRAGVVAAAQAAESRHALRALCLFAVLLTARVITTGRPGGGDAAFSLWAPIAYLWQDVLVALLFFVVFFALERSLTRPSIAWGIYAVVVAYVAINVPVTLVLSTPLTWTILRAARGPLADSIVHTADARNLAALALPAAVGVALPLLFWRAHGCTCRRRGVRLAAAIAVAAVGSVRRVACRHQGRASECARGARGHELPASALRPGAGDWRASPFGARAGEDLTRLRGSMRGRNVMVVILESTGARHLGIYGGTPDPMPNLTELARRSILFERAYAVYPESIKGLFATLCSRYPAFDTSPELYADVPCASLPGRPPDCRLPHGAVPLGAVRVSRHDGR